MADPVHSLSGEVVEPRGRGRMVEGPFCQMRHGHTSRGQYIALKLLAAELRRRHKIIRVYSLIEKPDILLYSYILPFGTGLGPRVGCVKGFRV